MVPNARLLTRRGHAGLPGLPVPATPGGGRRLPEFGFQHRVKAATCILTWFLVFVMVFLSAMFSGLTLGLLGLDKTGLEIVMGGGSPQGAR